MSVTANVLVRDLPVGAPFTRGNDGVYTKREEVGATGDGWCYCTDSSGDSYRFQWDSCVAPANIGGTP